MGVSRLPTDPGELVPDLQSEELAALEPLVRGVSVVEWGSGGSTIWLAKRARFVRSVEHDPAWHARVDADLRKLGKRSCDVALCEAEGWEPSDEDGDLRHFSLYVHVRAPASGVVALIDGRARVACFAWAALNGCKTIAVHDWGRPEYAGCAAIAGPPSEVVGELAIWRRP